MYSTRPCPWGTGGSPKTCSGTRIRQLTRHRSRRVDRHAPGRHICFHRQIQIGSPSDASKYLFCLQLSLLCWLLGPCSFKQTRRVAAGKRRGPAIAGTPRDWRRDQLLTGRRHSKDNLNSTYLRFESDTPLAPDCLSGAKVHPVDRLLGPTSRLPQCKA